MRRILITAALLLSAMAPVGGTGEPSRVLTGDAVPRLEPFSVHAVNCAGTSCLDIAWRVRGEIGPRLRWQMTVLGPDGVAVYRGSGSSTRGRQVSGRLYPARRPRCGPYRVTLLVRDRDGDHFAEVRTGVRRHRCMAPNSA